MTVKKFFVNFVDLFPAGNKFTLATKENFLNPTPAGFYPHGPREVYSKVTPQPTCFDMMRFPGTFHT